jgi:UDP-3-O-[3-hydroxymyristoyl] glucosamine N-acyltransferase
MITLKKAAELVEGKLKGDPDYQISGINSVHSATRKEISFLARDINIDKIDAGALIVKQGSSIPYPNLIFVESPYLSFARLLEFFFPSQRFNQQIDKNAYVSPGASIGKEVTIGPFSYIGDGAVVGDGTEIHAGVAVYRDTVIGRNCLIYSNVVVMDNVRIGDRVIIHPGAVIGSDGFGFTRDNDGCLVKIPQKGKVIIGNSCEIGANVCIDRSTIEATELKENVKLDNLVQVGHNVKIGKSTAVSGLTGISGSAEIGAQVTVAGQVGIADHIKIADGTMIAGKTGVTKNIKEKTILAGYPCQEIGEWRRSHVLLRNLEKTVKRIKDLEKRIQELEEKK